MNFKLPMRKFVVADEGYKLSRRITTPAEERRISHTALLESLARERNLDPVQLLTSPNVTAGWVFGEGEKREYAISGDASPKAREHVQTALRDWCKQNRVILSFVDSPYAADAPEAQGPTPSRSVFADNLSRLLGLHLLSTAEAAELLGVTPQTMWLLMSDRRKPGPGTLNKIGRLFGILPSRLQSAPFAELLEKEIADPSRFRRVESAIARKARQRRRRRRS